MTLGLVGDGALEDSVPPTTELTLGRDEFGLLVLRARFRNRVGIKRRPEQKADSRAARTKAIAKPEVVEVAQQFRVDQERNERLVTGHRVQSNPSRFMHAAIITGCVAYAV